MSTELCPYNLLDKEEMLFGSLCTPTGMNPSVLLAAVAWCCIGMMRRLLCSPLEASPGMHAGDVLIRDPQYRQLQLGDWGVCCRMPFCCHTGTAFQA